MYVIYAKQSILLKIIDLTMKNKLNLDILKLNEHRLTFNEEDHIYYWDNIKINTSITSIIKSLGPNYGEIDPAILQAAGVRGTMVHKWIEDYFNSVPEPHRQMLASYKPYIDAFLKWVEQYGERYEMLFNELKLFSPAKGIAGTVDAIIYDKELDTLCVLDFKTTANPIEDMVSAQLAAYSQLIEEWGIAKIDMGMVLYLGKNGEFKFKAVDLVKGNKLFNKCYKEYKKGH